MYEHDDAIYDLDEFVEESARKVVEENEKDGVLFPFLYSKKYNFLIVARLIKTKRTDQGSVCWAALQPNGKPNGIFWSADEAKQEIEGLVEVRCQPVKVDKITVVRSDMSQKVLRFDVSTDNLMDIFRQENAVFVKDLAHLR